MNALRIDRAVAADLPAARDLLHRNNLPLDGVDALLGHFLVAREEGAIVGTAGLELYSGGVLLRSVAVDSAARGRGLGQRLTDAALAMARESGAPAAFLLTTTAAAFFPRFGFTRIERDEVPADICQSVEFTSACPASAIVMRKRL